MAGLINYVKKAFKNYPNTTTKISAENLNHLDDGIFDLDQAVKSAIDDINNDINGLNNDLTKKALVNTYYDSSTKKLYQVNADGTQGGEIAMNRMLDWTNSQHRNTSGSINVNKDSKVLGFIRGTGTQPLCTIKVTIDGVNYTAMQVANDATNASNDFDVPAGATVTLSVAGNYGYITVIPYI